MARKKYQDEPENHDRWLISYADFITLLFALFVVLYAISSVNEGKYRVLSNALGNAFGRVSVVPGVVVEPPAALPIPGRLANPNTRRNEAIRREREQMTSMARDILKVLAPLIREGKVRVAQTSLGVSVEINASVLFSPGDAKLTDESGQALKAVATVLKDDTHAIQVEGHTDNVPISNFVFPSNWELSAVRASSVVRLFIENGIAETRLTAVGYGPTRPIVENESVEGRSKNRRVTVTILSAMQHPSTEVPVGGN
ncbi:MAG: flagellar motor protein MotD [Oxalobacteraceae bacterium]|nr:flagellar motor protein MotD [Oxalobacteraceae bacterium]